MRRVLAFLLPALLLLVVAPLGAAEQEVGAGDVLEVSVDGDAELSGRYTVSSFGDVSLPRLDKLYVKGFTPEQLGDVLSEMLAVNGVYPKVLVRIQKHPPPSGVIQPGDRLNIKVAGEEQLSGVFTVSGAGQLVYPLLGEVDIQGLTVEQIQQRLKRDLGANYLVNPDVAVELSESRRNSMDISGAVGKPGNYIVTPNLTLLRLITQAGGITGNVSLTRVRLVREMPDGKKDSKSFDFESLVREDGTDPKLEPGDLVFVELSKESPEGVVAMDRLRVTILGEISSPGNFAFEKGATLVRLIGQAGGFRAGAASNRLRLVRNAPGGEKRVMMVNAAAVLAGRAPDIELADGDLITVPESFF